MGLNSHLFLLYHIMAKHIDLFKLIKIMFEDRRGYMKLTNMDKERNSFMCNRLFSIQFPMQAHMLSLNGLKGHHIVDFWQKIALRNNRVPPWIYTKTKNNQTKQKPFKYTMKDPEVEFLMKKRDWGVKDWEGNLTLNRDALKKELDRISKQINIQIKEK